MERPAGLNELSGAAISHTEPNVVWVLADGGNGEFVWKLGGHGSVFGRVEIDGVRNTDWEDMDSFTWRGRPWLLIADVGDNLALRDSVSLHIVGEPSGASRSVPVGWTVRFRYPDGPRDCEAVAVDAADSKVLLISKRTRPPIAYEVPLRPPSGEVVVARRLGSVSLPAESPIFGPYAAQPTGMAISPDGQTAAVLTYARVHLFRRQPGQSWAEAFAAKPVSLPRHGLAQAEAITFSADGREILVFSEGSGEPVKKYELSAD
ncbi:MAG: hypothetical protein SFU53_06145 [Terrimicrobiaceae bacterium]|nr:hypothetical protein [Terrimicrobiaceae bacterium]